METLRDNGKIDIALGMRIGYVIPDELESHGKRNKFWFNDWKYLFKEIYEGTYENYAELISSEIASYLGIPCAKYDLAINGDKEGVITENFINESIGEELILASDMINEVYNRRIVPLKQACITFKKLLTRYNLNFTNANNATLELKRKLAVKAYEICDFYNILNGKNKEKYIINNRMNEQDINNLFIEYLKSFESLDATYSDYTLDRDNDILKMNNLTDVWYVISEYLKLNNLYSDDVLSNIMNDLVNMFMFDIITLQGDRHHSNWGIIRNNETNAVKMAPLFDNSNMCNLNRTKAIKSVIKNVEGLSNVKDPVKKANLYNDFKSQIYHNSASFTVDEDDKINKSKNIEIINKFISISSHEYIQQFINKLEYLKNNGMQNIFKNIEEKIKAEIPASIKMIVEASISLNIEEILNNSNIYTHGRSI